MQHHGLLRATVVSAGINPGEAAEIEDWISSTYSRFSQRIDLVDMSEVRAWLTEPTAAERLISDFLWRIGEELDEFSTDANRRAWFEVLTNFVSQA